MALSTPILFLIFNRPDTTEKVFEAIAAQKPLRLYIAADGPRESKNGEVELCKRTRDIASRVDWPCEVKTLFRDKNLGCRTAVSEGINWFFEHEEQGIILEDDCLPHPDFFRFCEEGLNLYKTNYRVMHINGYNPQPQKTDARFTNFISIWGWATWRRAWNLYDVEAKYYRSFTKQNLIAELFPRSHYLISTFITDVVKGLYNTWDLQWALAIHVYFGSALLPPKNLIRNIGFGAETTHSASDDEAKLSLSIDNENETILWSLPKEVSINSELDDQVIEYFNGKSALLKRLIYLKSKIRSDRKNEL